MSDVLNCSASVMVTSCGAYKPGALHRIARRLGIGGPTVHEHVVEWWVLVDAGNRTAMNGQVFCTLKHVVVLADDGKYTIASPAGTVGYPGAQELPSQERPHAYGRLLRGESK